MKHLRSIDYSPPVKLDPDPVKMKSCSALNDGKYRDSLRIGILCLICFVLPMRVSFPYWLSAFLALCVVLDGRLMERIRAISSSPLCYAFVGYFMVFLISMLWTENIYSGWHMIARQYPFLLFVLYWSSAESSCRERYISFFIAGVATCAVLAHYNWLQFNVFHDWPQGIRVFKSVGDTAPFVDRILYTPILAIGTYLAAHRLLNQTSTRGRVIFSLVLLLLLSNLAFSGGRAGMVSFLAMFLFLVREHVASFSRAAVIFVISVLAASTLLYSSSHYFAQRVDEAIYDIRNLETEHNTSVGQRIIYWTTSSMVFLEHPLIGVGAGDFQLEYIKMKPEKWADTPDSFNPHNQFLMTGVTTGLLGLSLLGSIFFLLLRASGDVRTRAILAGYATVCMFESYLWRSNTAMTFSVLFAVLSAPVDIRKEKLSES